MGVLGSGCGTNLCMSLPALRRARGHPSSPALPPSGALPASLHLFLHLILRAGKRLSWQKLSWQPQRGSAGRGTLIIQHACFLHRWLGIYRRCRAAFEDSFNEVNQHLPPLFAAERNSGCRKKYPKQTAKPHQLLPTLSKQAKNAQLRLGAEQHEDALPV